MEKVQRNSIKQKTQWTWIIEKWRIMNPAKYKCDRKIDIKYIFLHLYQVSTVTRSLDPFASQESKRRDWKSKT